MELAAVVTDTDDLTEAFDRVIHRDGENWTDNSGIIFFGDPRGRRSTHEGDVFVSGDGVAHLVLPHGFRALPGLRLPYQPQKTQEFAPAWENKQAVTNLGEENGT